MKKDKNLSYELKKQVYKEQFDINIKPSNLLNKHTLIIFEKENNVNEINFSNENLVITSYSIHYTKLYERKPRGEPSAYLSPQRHRPASDFQRRRCLRLSC